MLREYLKNHAKTRKTINLIQLEQVWPSGEGREGFVEAMDSLQAEGVLEPVKRAGRSPQGMAQRYRIRMDRLAAQQRNNLRKLHMELHPDISLLHYFKSHESELEKDLPDIKKVDEALRLKGLPQHPMTMPELSLWLMEDEKWLMDQRGRELLMHLGLWPKLEPWVMNHPEPLMLAANLNRISNEKGPLNILVVENKSTYYAWIKDPSWHCLVYGAGWKIVGNIRMLPQQLDLPAEKLMVTYFGDLDPEGIRIWHTLFRSSPFPVVPAVNLYKKLMKCPWRKGKENQRLEDVTQGAISRFVGFFSSEEADELAKRLNQREYIPQEALDTASTTI